MRSKKRHRLQTLQENTVFSYQVKQEVSTIVLSQLETGFLLSIKIEQFNDTLRVTKFTLDHHANITTLSPELNDAAVLEMLLQAVMILFIQAQQFQKAKILFILSQEDVDYLSIIEGFFDDISSENGKVLFTIYNTPKTREFLVKKVSIIKTKMEQELWKAQRTDPYLKTYLQHHKKGERLPCPTVPSQTWDNVVMFPSLQ